MADKVQTKNNPKLQNSLNQLKSEVYWFAAKKPEITTNTKAINVTKIVANILNLFLLDPIRLSFKINTPFLAKQIDIINCMKANKAPKIIPITVPVIPTLKGM